ncbi:MAG: hypothetical protein HY262_07045 [Chloroflexi bacterium]|nr:hypothetical protein [Chloroflexota bacterium]
MDPLSMRNGQAATTVEHRPSRTRQRGQGLIIFAAAVVFLIGLLAIVVDVTWYWARTLQVQKAADAAALAGAVWLPEQPTTATSVALASAKQNGYVPGGGVTVTAVQDSLTPGGTNPNQLDTTVSAPVPTFFMHLFGINTLQATRTAKAEYVLPVPMGSPLNYFGAFGALRGTIHVDSGFWFATATMPPTGTWTNVNNALLDADTTNTEYAETSNENPQGFGNFNIPLRGTSQSFVAKGGIEVKVVGHASVAAGCKVQVDISRDGGVTWRGGTISPYSIGQSASPGLSQTLGAGPDDTTLIFGGEQSSSATDTGDWFGWSNWTSAQFSNANFRVRVQPLGSPCIDSIDSVSVKVTYDAVNPPVVGPSGESLAQQGVWATALSQGADIVNGDIYGPQDNGSVANSEYHFPASYYDYAVEMQPGTSDGSVAIFDPVFCATSGNGDQGMGDRWFTTGSRGMSTFYDLYDTNNTPYDLSDDIWIAGNTGPAGSTNPLYDLFRRINGTDPSQGGPTVTGGRISCELGATTDPTNGAYWHNRWWTLATGLPGPTGLTPKVYRIRETTTDPAASSDQGSVDAQNSFSIFADVAGHTCPDTPIDPACPRVYGLGTMEAFTPLNESTAADLYLSQIGPAYAGKTIKVSLWDPGDTGVLTADLSFLMPTSTGYQTAGFSWTATKFSRSGSASNCNGNSAGTVTSVRTNQSGTSRFNGCWIVINIPIPPTYDAPTPPGETGAGWWKIRYTMGSSSSPGTQSAFDLTTWKTQLIGNPVHLVVP